VLRLYLMEKEYSFDGGESERTMFNKNRIPMQTGGDSTKKKLRKDDAEEKRWGQTGPAERGKTFVRELLKLTEVGEGKMGSV